MKASRFSKALKAKAISLFENVKNAEVVCERLRIPKSIFLRWVLEYYGQDSNFSLKEGFLAGYDGEANKETLC